MSKNLFEIADSVETEIDFLNFLETLMQDRQDEEQKEKANPSSPYTSVTNGWENGSISTFLDAAMSWGKESENIPSYTKPENPWKRAAHILHAGKFYE